MISNRWVAVRKIYWERLEAVLRKTKSGLSALSGAEVHELGLLYRQTASDLAVVREDPSGAQYAAYLNQLLGKSHNVLYTGRRASRFGVFGFYRDIYPGVFRETLPLTALAFAIFLAGLAIGWLLSAHDPQFTRYLAGAQLVESIEHKRMWTESIVSVKPVASSSITTNNLSVAFSTFALGITGLGPIWMMFFNGLLVGAIGQATGAAGMALPFWSFVAPHGVLELPAIFIAGGAGLNIARGLLFPGMLPRRESLIIAGRKSVLLVLGAIPLLLVAGVIEGFLSPSHVAPAFKFTLAGVLFSVLLAYLLGSKPGLEKTAVFDS